MSDLIPRTGWDPGPWDDEPDRFEWVDETTNFPCLIIRHPLSGNLCGYVAVPRGNPFYGVDRDDAALRGIDVHDNITYAAPCMAVDDIPDDAKGSPWFHPDLLVCHVPEPGEPDDVWWLGFAASRYDDIQPGHDARVRRQLGGDEVLARMNSGKGRRHYRNLDYMRGECTRLAAQLCEWTP